MSTLRITYNNFEISLGVFMLNITTNYAITYTNLVRKEEVIISKAGIKAKENEDKNGVSSILRALEALEA